MDSAELPATTRVRLWYVRFQREIHEVASFGVVGVVAWVVDTVVFNAFYSYLRGDYVAAAVISTTISASVAFVGNRFWTWRDRPRSTLRREYLLYAIFNAIGLLIGLGCLLFSHKLLGAFWPDIFHTQLADNVAKQGFGLLLGTAFRFWSYRRYVFVGLAPPQTQTMSE